MHQNHWNEKQKETLFHWDCRIYGVSPQSQNDNGGLLSCNFSDTFSLLDEQTDHFEFYNDKWVAPISSHNNNNLFCGKLIANKGCKLPPSLKIHRSFFKSPNDVHKRTTVSGNGTSTQEN